MKKIKNKVCNIIINNDYSEFNKLLNLKNKYDEILILTDENVYKYQLEFFRENIEAKFIYEYIVSSGENSKSVEVYEEVISYMMKSNFSRKSLIIAFGGGVVGDLGGFLASTYMRGIDFIQVPTTLLSMVDSSVGGKTGINIGKYKNIIGTFYRPKFTYINTNTLNTLDYDEYLSGLCEVIKYGVIYDYNILTYLKNNKENILNKEAKTLEYIIKKCVQIKANIVSDDEFENGIRKILNFGHTFGHGIENLLNISHGYSVSIGMSIAFSLSLKKNLIEKEYFDTFMELLDYYNLPTKFYSDDENIEEKIFAIMKSDKKNSFSNINLILPVAKTNVEEVSNIDKEEIIEIIRLHKN